MKTFDEIVNEMPVGLERSLGRLMAQRKGRENVIERDELLRELTQQSHLRNATDRQMRLAIQFFRTQGIRICHNEKRLKDPDTGKVKISIGYYLAANEQEYREFRARYGSYANTIYQVIKSMDEERQVLTEDGDVTPPPDIEIQGELFPF